MRGGSPFRIVGRYELHDELASGGMATVHLGRSIGAAGFAKSVAIKRLHPQYARDAELARELLEEARLSERIRHPNVVATLDVVAADHELLLVMEYVHGETLARLLRRAGELGQRCPPPIAASIAHAVLLGLHAAHTATDVSGAPLCIVHRDVSPQNIMVGADGEARLLDFGIAKAAGASTHTREGVVKGKVPYMAPEILRLAPATPQTDVFGVGVILWESLCGRRLFKAESDVALWAKVLACEVPRPSTIVGDLGALEAVVMRGLAESAAERFPSALAMAEALEGALRLAPSSEIAAWVREQAADSLAERSAIVQAIERLPPSAFVAELATPAPVPPPAAPVAVVAPPRVRSRVWLVAALALAMVVALGVSLRFATMRRASASAHVAASPAPEAASAVAVDSAVPQAPATGVAAAVASARPAEPATGPRVRRPAPAAAASSARPRPSQDPCDPPYTLDEAGRKHFKLNCVE